MNFLKSAVVCICIALAPTVAGAEGPDATMHDLAAKCAARNGTFDTNSMQCAEPGEDSAAGDLVVGPMMRVLGSEAQDAAGAGAGQ
jgi:hypothetical protein